MGNREGLVRLYAEMAALTRQQCGQCLTYCCNDYYCEQTAKYATSMGVTLQRTDHPKIPFLGPDGCIVPPHLRPICSVHICEKLLWKDRQFSKKYFKLRDRICLLECEASGYPEGCADCHGDIPQN